MSNSAGRSTHGDLWSTSASRPAIQRLAGTPFEPVPVPTSAHLAEAITAAAGARRCSVRGRTGANAGLSAPVHIELTLSPFYNPLYANSARWCAEFHISCAGARYKVKDVGAMIDAFDSRGRCEYGARLAFDHAEEAFDDVSLRVLRVASVVCARLRARFASSSALRDFSSAQALPLKELPLNDVQAIRLLDALEGGEVGFKENRGSRRQVLALTSDTPYLPCALVPSTDGGYNLRLPARTWCLACRGDAYVIGEGRAFRVDDAFAHDLAPFLSRVLPVRGPLHLSEHDAAAFCRVVLPQLDAYCDLTLPEGFVPSALPAAFCFRIGIDGGLVVCTVEVSYGAWSARLIDLDEPDELHAEAGEPLRDALAETRAADVVAAYFDETGPEGLPAFSEANDECLYQLLTRGLSDLAETGEVLLSDKLRQISVRPAPSLGISATVENHLLDVELGATGMSYDDLLSYLEAYRARQKYVRLSSGDIVKIDRSARAAVDMADDLGVELSDLVHGASLPIGRALLLDAIFDDASELDIVRDEAFEQAVRAFDTLADQSLELPRTLGAMMRGYQVEGYMWLGALEHLGLGGILADDMGLGKTLQMIAHILARVEAGDTDPTLVVCPASLVYNWIRELERFAPSLDSIAVVGQREARLAAIARACEHQVIVTSYDLMRLDIDAYEDVSFARVVLDEAQYIKNPATKVARSAKRLHARVRFALTGTPVENRTAELWSIMDFLQPGLLGSRRSFAKRFETPVEHGDEVASRHLHRLIAPFVLRRVKGDVMADLPEKSESIVYAHMEDEQLMLYRALEERVATQVQHEMPRTFKKNKLKILAELTHLRQICCDPHLYSDDYHGGSAKLETCVELVRTALDGGHRILLFSQFTSMLDIIEGRLGREGVNTLKMTGANSKEERAKMVESFQAGGADVFLISLKAGGVGLNLTGADVVIHYDPWWNVAAQDQATDRAHRIGQTRDVNVYRLIVKGTIEERICAMQERKRELAEDILAGTSVNAASLDKEQLIELLRDR